jgi:hypothetical protein
MVDNLLVQDLLLVVLLWLGGLLYEKWVCRRSAPYPTTRQTATPLHRHSRNPKPFPGLTHKPHGAACDHLPEPGSPARAVPLWLLPAKPGRPRQVDTSAQFCPLPNCPYYG